MEQIVLKSEVQGNGEILLFNFYVDESKNNEEDTTSVIEQPVQYVHNEAVEMQEDKYIIEEIDDTEHITQSDLAAAQDDTEKWLDDEERKLLIFYMDNKEAFVSGTTKRKYLWDVACNTMLRGKNHISCELKLKHMMKKYAEHFVEKNKGIHVTWPYFSACHESFFDNNEVKILIDQYMNETTMVEINVPPISAIQKTPNTSTSNEKVDLMLNLYLKHKQKFQKNESQRGLWELIVLEMGEQDVDYWHRRFLNYKQHYIRILHKQKESGTTSVAWPYMKAFDEIFKNDEDFHKKWSQQVSNKQNSEQAEGEQQAEEISWSDMEKTFLMKYYFDCFHEFLDDTIPNMFLWNEVGRLLDKKADDCKETFAELKDDHTKKIMKGGYDLTTRVPMEIVVDNIISKEVDIQIQTDINNRPIVWKTEQIDELVQYLYDNTEMLKDPVCYNICWYVLGHKWNVSPAACKSQWEDLTKLYKTILNDKKENPDMSIDWRYMELFDRIFDYGMATDLLESSEKSRMEYHTQPSKMGVKKITIKDENGVENGVEDEEEYDERGFVKYSKRQEGDAKAFKILEYYLKHKQKFSSSQGKRVALWEALSKQIGISATECAHRFRNFKQVYKGYVKREISKPEKPITWPYYTICKKVFGYRVIKNKVKNELKSETDDEDWSAKDIKTLINFFAINFHDLKDNIGDSTKWMSVAQELGRGPGCCGDKFMELRKSYRKLKTMKSRNPLVKVSWKYFNLMDQIYSSDIATGFDENVGKIVYEKMQNELYNENNIKQELQDDDYTIIVIPEGEDFNNAPYILPGGENIIQEYTGEAESYTEDLANVKQERVEKTLPKWTKRSKRRLLILYLNYLRTHKGKEVNSTDMWKEIASKFGDRKPVSCKKMFIKLKERHKLVYGEETTTENKLYSSLFEKILALKPKYAKNQNNAGESRIYKDYPIDDSKVELALKYYLQNIDEFISPKFEKKYLWTELANYISEPVSKVFNKINYMIQFYKSSTLEAENTRFGDILKEIFIKENLLNDIPDGNKTVEEVEYTWTDDEIETLLTWYLAHLEKFKNPKFVRSYLWMEASDILKKSPWACSNKMSEIRTQYRTMVKENPDVLNDWRFTTLCQRIYGTGKKNNPAIVN